MRVPGGVPLHEFAPRCVSLYVVMRLFVILLSFSAAWGGEFAIFSSGIRMRIDRHEVVDGARLRLYEGGGYTELDSSRVLRFEPDDRVTTTPKAEPAAPASVQLTPEHLTPEQLADRAADKYGLPRPLVRSVMAAESGFARQAVSPKGAIGLMQLMPATAEELGIDPHDPAQNVDAGTRYLRDLLVKYGGALWHALAAYNAGPAAVAKYGTIPPYSETIRYINRIDREMKKSGGSN